MQNCKKCGKAELKKRTGQKYGTNYVYVNDVGCRWYGNVCPPCHASAEVERQVYYKTHAPVKDGTYNDIGPKQVLNPSKTKKCRGCGLSTVNYYKCQACTSHNQAAYFMEAMGGVAY